MNKDQSSTHQNDSASNGTIADEWNNNQPVSEAKSKIIVIGLSKTGTSTLKEMLTKLGYHVCGPRKELIGKVRAGDYSAIDPFLDAYNAFEDWPWPLTYKYIWERFGCNAKFILTTRISTDKWFESIEQHGYTSGPFKSMRDTYGFYRPFGRKKEFCKIYQDHNNEVREFFSKKPDQFIEFCLESGDGWEKLCDFLKEPVLDINVPHLNRSSKKNKKANRFINKTIEQFYKFIIKRSGC